MKLYLTAFFALLISLPALASTPKVNLSYAEVFDSVCANQTDFKIDPRWVNELKNKIPDFQASWQKWGPALLDGTKSVVGKSFKTEEYSVALSACSFPSMSDPLLINMRYALSSFTKTPIPKEVTVGVIFHEILHHYLTDKIPTHSKLLEKYHAEDKTVLNHVHLLALQKAVYLKLKQEDVLKEVIAKDLSLQNKSYVRAWEIVNEREDYKAFVAELK